MSRSGQWVVSSVIDGISERDFDAIRNPKVESVPCLGRRIGKGPTFLRVELVSVIQYLLRIGT